MGTDRQPHLGRVPVPSQPLTVRIVVQVAVEAVQALGRAEGAVLFVAEDGGLAVAASTVDPSRLVQASKICSGFFRAGCMTSALVPSLRGILIGKVAFRAVPLVRRGLLMGVLYLEGLAEPPDRVEGLVQRCAEVIAMMLEASSCFDRADTRPERADTRVVPWSDGQ